MFSLFEGNVNVSLNRVWFPGSFIFNRAYNFNILCPKKKMCVWTLNRVFMKYLIDRSYECVNTPKVLLCIFMITG